MRSGFERFSRHKRLLNSQSDAEKSHQRTDALRQYVPSATVHFEKEIINSARSYVDGPLHENLSLSVIVAKFYISRYQVSRLFKQSFGVNYQDYVLSVRMKVAAHQLRHTNMRLYENSNAISFDKSSYFSNVFKN